MTFDEKLAICYKMVEHLKHNQLYDDVKQEIALMIWENQDDEDLKRIVVMAGKRIFGGELKHHIIRKQTNSRDKDGNLIDFEVVDESTVEQFGVRKSPVTDEMRETVADIAKCNELILKIFKRKRKKINEMLHIPNCGFSSTIKNFHKQCFKGMLKNVTNTNV
ncbi:MAG: hypothetical protein VZR95_04150 [Alphaproteobacteria bacterium]